MGKPFSFWGLSCGQNNISEYIGTSEEKIARWWMFDSKGLFLNLALFLKYVQKSQEYLNFKEMLTHTKEGQKTA